MSDILAQLQAACARIPEPPRIARLEVGQALLDWLKATARPEGAPPEDAWRPVGWTPPPGIGSLLDVPVMLSLGLEPNAWRAIDRDGQVMEEGGGLWSHMPDIPTHLPLDL